MSKLDEGKAIGKFYRVNSQIQAREVRLIGEDAKQLGIFPLGEALKIAQEKGLDLVEIAPEATPSVCRLVELKKFRYEERRKEKEARKKTKEVELKEVRLSPFISRHDFEVRMKGIRKFLKKKDRVKVTVKFKGRQMGHTEFGHRVLGTVISGLGGEIKIEREARLDGRQLSVIIGPK